MYQHILLPTDGSDRSIRAINAGIELARALNAKVTGLYVIERTYIPGIDEGLHPLAEAALSIIAERAKEAGIVSVCVSLFGETPQDVIVQYAGQNGCDLIIMGTHGRSKVGKLVLGSAAASVIADCKIPVLLYR